jgi:hypothetical protein
VNGKRLLKAEPFEVILRYLLLKFKLFGFMPLTSTCFIIPRDGTDEMPSEGRGNGSKHFVRDKT